MTFGALLIYSAHITHKDESHIMHSNVNLALNYYHDHSSTLSDFKFNNPLIYEELDSYLINLLSLLALWGGVAIIL